MISFARIEWPVCPECKTVINDHRIICMNDFLFQRSFKEKECPSCKKKFLMNVRAELLTEVIAVEQTP